MLGADRGTMTGTVLGADRGAKSGIMTGIIIGAGRGIMAGVAAGIAVGAAAGAGLVPRRPRSGGMTGAITMRTATSLTA